MDPLGGLFIGGLADAVVAFDDQGRIVYLNAAAEALLGARAAELAGVAVDELAAVRSSDELSASRSGERIPLHLQLAAAAAENAGRVLRLPIRRRDGVVVEVEATCGLARSGCDEWIVASLRRLPASVEEPRPGDSDEDLQRYRRVFESAPIGIIHFDARGVIIACNETFAQMLGSSRRLLVGLDMMTLPNQRVVECVRTALAGRPSRFEGDYTAVTSGKTTPLHADFSPLVTGDGAVIGGVGVVEDISEQRAAVEALRRSEVAFRTLIESAPDAIAVHRDLKFIYVNPAMVRTLGCERPDELLGRSVTEVFPANERETRIKRADGTQVVAELESRAIHFDGAEAVIVFGRDVTERRTLQQRLILADRMASVGTLAAGVAHEINNPLAYVMASLDLAARKLALLRGKGAPGASDATLTQIAASLENAREGADRVKTIVRDLRTFSRADEDRRVLVDIERVLDATLNVAWNEIRTRARLVKEYGSVSAVWGDESRLGQVFLNLLINAAQAIPDGAPKEHEIRVTTRDVGDGRVSIEVRDTGAGIPRDLISRIFEPFVTTKPIGVGTGLGLSICHGIVTALGGEILVESELGRGSVFRVELPGRSERKTTPAGGVPITALNRQRILLIDDEVVLARALRKELGQRHEVVVATSGPDAIELLLHDDRFDMVLCDVHMPEMSGAAVYDEIRQARPGVHERFVFMTGGGFGERVAKQLEKLPNARLEKPFTLADVEALFRKRPRRV